MTKKESIKQNSSILKVIERLEEIKGEFNDWESFKGFVGLTIIDYFLSDDKRLISFKFKDDENRQMMAQYYVTTCGGYSAWVESIDGIEEILGHKIINVNNHDGEDIEDNEHDGLVFNVEIVSPKGSCVIDFRSNCNGYYGANLSLMNVTIIAPYSSLSACFRKVDE